MEYKGYVGMVEIDDKVDIFHGEVANLRDVITFQGRSVDELRQAFVDSIDDYLSWCAERGKTPDKPFSGKFVVRLDPETHREISTAARKSGKSLNAWVTDNLAAASRGGGAS
jgi:predicted HicB family RNase H-like nuclease